MSSSDLFQEIVDHLKRALTPITTTTAATSVTTTTTSSTSNPPVIASLMARRAPYSGRAEDCNSFLLQCSLTLEMQLHLNHTTSSGYVRRTSGRPPSWVLRATTNTASCRMDLSRGPPYSRTLCMRYSGSFSIDSYSFTSTTYSYTPGVGPNIASMLRRSYNIWRNMSSSWKQKSVPSISLQ